MPRSAWWDMQASRFPLQVSSYDEAKAWLWQYSHPEKWVFNPALDLPLEAQLVCAVYWVSEAQLVSDMHRIWSDAMRPSRESGGRKWRS